MVELGFSHRAAFLASLFTILDNSLIIQSRVIMLDSFVIFLSYLSILCYLKFYHLRHKPFSGEWHRGLIYTGLSLGTLLGVKYTGLLGLGCVGLLTLCDLWQLIADTTIDLLDFLLHFLLRGVYMLGIPLVISLILFFVHFSILVNSGPGNAFVSKPFRNTLTGAVETTPEPVHLSSNTTLLRYGSHVSLKSTDTVCWLHSHPHLYPLKYPDDRGSSYQQQVTCYEFADINNLWEVRRPLGPGGVAGAGSDSHDPVRNRDLVELVHINTSKILNSHDVAAPLTPTHQEVAGYVNYSAQFVPHLEWRLEVTGVPDGSPVFHEKGKLKLKLVHEHSKQALACTGKRLPEWAFQQYEVVTEKDVSSTAAVWLLDDVILPSPSNATAWAEEERLIREKAQNPGTESAKSEDEDDDSEETLNFFEKYIELQVHMATAHGNLGEHQFGATPHSWPLMGKLLPYWLDEKSNAQVTLIGNPVMWWVASVGIVVFLAVTAVHLLRRRREIFDLPHAEFHQWWTSGIVLLVGWLAHYIPYFILSRVLFLHHYLPAVPFKLMLLAAVCEHFYIWLKRFPGPISLLYHLLISLLLLSFFVSFIVFAPFTYGYPGLSRDQIEWRKWYHSWDLLHR
jgi:dolichyl-phosphate-mannose-protein mannosyltransferase